MTRVGVCSRSFSRHPVLRAELLERYPASVFNDEGRRLEGDDLVRFLGGCDKAIIGLETVNAGLFSALPELKVISKYGVGFDAIDLDDVARAGVRLGWTGGVNRRSVAELVVAFAVALLRRIPEAGRQIADGGWPQPPGRQLSERTVGIIGCGHVGKDLAQLLRAFGSRVLAHDIREFPDFYAKHGVQPVGLRTLLQESDVVSLHVPLDATTRDMLSAERLALMKNDAVLINTARGGIVDEQALKAMLKDGRLAGAAFDVFATEPPEDMELVRLGNFIATPHIGGGAEEAVLAMGRAAIKGLDDNRIPEPGVFPDGY